MADQGSRMLRRAVALIERPKAERSDEEMEVILPWFAKIATPFHALEKDKVMTLLRYCDYKKVPRDDVIIRQGAIGDCFYVLLSGKSSLYIDLAALDDLDMDDGAEGHEVKVAADTWEEVWDRSGKRCLRLDRSKFGGYITSFEAGKGFGEMALIDPRCVRSGSIIADEECELLIIDQYLFNETLKERQEAERKKRWAFIESSPLFSNWQSKMKRLLDMSLVQKVYPFDCCIVRQGRPVTGLHFIIRGQALVTVNPRLHPHQYPRVFDRRMEILAAELSKNADKKEAPSKKDSQFPPQQKIHRPEVVRSHVTAADRHLSTKCQNICAVDQSEIIGALEFVMGLDTYAQNVVSRSELEVFVLDSRSIDRLFNKAKHSSTSAYLVDQVQERLRARLTFSSASKVELYRHLWSILDERKRKETLDRKSRPNKDASAADPSDPSSRGPPSDGPSGPGGAEDGYRLPSGRKTVDPGSKAGVHSLATYYKSNIAERAGLFSRAYLRSREGGYGRLDTDLSLGGRRLMMERATRLLPRSRRELEHVATGLKAAKPKPKRKQNDAIERYLNTPQSMFIEPEKLDLVRALIHEADQSTAADNASAVDDANPSRTDAVNPTGTKRSSHSSLTATNVTTPTAQSSRTTSAAYSSGTGDGRGSSESDEEEREVMLDLEETVSNVKLRSVALRIGDYHQELNEERKQNIFNSVFDSRRMADKRQSVVAKVTTRPRMTPGSTKIPFDLESSDETLTLVEDKLRRFYSGLEMRENESPIVQKLHRFRIMTPEDAPIPAGTVYVCRRSHGNDASRCSSNHGNDVLLESGEAANSRPKTRRYMIPKMAYPLLINALPKQDAQRERELRS